MCEFEEKNWNELPEAVESPSLEILRSWLDMAFTNLLLVVHISQCCMSPVPARTVRTHIITLGKIGVVGQLREMKCQAVLETDTLILSLYVAPSYAPPGIPTTPWKISASLQALVQHPPCKLSAPWSICRMCQGQSLEETMRFLMLSWDSSCPNWDIYSVDTYSWGSPSKIPFQLTRNGNFQVLTQSEQTGWDKPGVR